jgi:hypothetical protein
MKFKNKKMAFNPQGLKNYRKSIKSRKNSFIFILFFFVNAFLFAQNPVAEVYSGRIKNSEKGSSFYFRILDVNQVQFEAYSNKSKEFVLFNNYKSGYSAEYKIGSLYYSSSKPFNLTDIHSLLKQLGFTKVKYDNEVIGVNELPGKPVTTREAIPENNARRN